MSKHKLAAGFALIESLVTIVVIAFGLLGVAGLVSRSFVTETEANQRTQAQLLLQDMAARMEANRANVATYMTGDNGITGYVDVNGNPTLVSCDPAAPLSTDVAASSVTGDTESPAATRARSASISRALP